MTKASAAAKKDLDHRTSRAFEVRGENIIIPASLRNFPGLLLLFLLSVAFAYLMTADFKWSLQWIELSDEFAIPIPLFGLISLMLAGLLFRRVCNARLVLTPEYLLFARGIMSWRTKSLRFEYDKIIEIEIDQTIIQKLFGVGDIIITPHTALRSSTVQMRGVRDPRSVKDLIMQKKREVLEAGQLDRT